ncbi:MAG: hypothetical protein U5M51_02355 [Emticicia sp.]|nr:hypothetical protein [Emticicia sp.]
MPSMECPAWNAQHGMPSMECPAWNAQHGMPSMECHQGLVKNEDPDGTKVFYD